VKPTKLCPSRRLQVHEESLQLEQVHRIAKALKQTNRIVSLEIVGCTLSERLLMIIVDAVAANSSIKQLAFADIGMSSSSCAKLCRALASHRAIRELDLSRNELDPSACKHVGKLLASNVSI